MKRLAAAFILGAGLAWLLFGRGPSAAELERAIARGDRVLAEVAGRDSAIAVLAAGWVTRDRAIDSLHREAGSFRLQASREADSAAAYRALAERAEAGGDLRLALKNRGLEALAWEASYESCTAGWVRDTLALQQCRQTAAEKDTALALRAESIDSLVGVVTENKAILSGIKPPPRWTAGVLWEPGSPVPVGGWLSRRVGPLVLQVEGTADRGEARGRLGLGLAF